MRPYYHHAVTMLKDPLPFIGDQIGLSKPEDYKHAPGLSRTLNGLTCILCNTVIAGSVAHHFDNVCEKILVECRGGCGFKSQRSEVAAHEIDCTQVARECPDCGLEIYTKTHDCVEELKALIRILTDEEACFSQENEISQHETAALTEQFYEHVR